MSRKTKADLETENRYLRQELAQKEEYIKTLEYLRAHDKARSKAYQGAKSATEKVITDLCDNLAPLQNEKHQQKERAEKKNADIREFWDYWKGIFKDLININGKTEEDAFEFVVAAMKNKTGDQRIVKNRVSNKYGDKYLKKKLTE